MNLWLTQILGEIAKKKESVNHHSGLLVIFLWQIWKGRNETVFNHKTAQLVGTLLAVEYLSMLYPNNPGSRLKDPPSMAGRWRPLPLGILKCNVDI